MMRRAFSMILAIIFIVVIATIAMLSLSLSTQAAKQTEHVYLREQAEMLALNAAELGILAMQQSDYLGTAENQWLNQVRVFYPNVNNWLLRATIDIDYMGDTTDPNNVVNNGAAVPQVLNNTENHGFHIARGANPALAANTPRDNVALLNVSVISNPALVNDRIRIFKSAIQRP